MMEQILTFPVIVSAFTAEAKEKYAKTPAPKTLIGIGILSQWSVLTSFLSTAIRLTF